MTSKNWAFKSLLWFRGYFNYDFLIFIRQLPYVCSRGVSNVNTCPKERFYDNFCASLRVSSPGRPGGGAKKEGVGRGGGKRGRTYFCARKVNNWWHQNWKAETTELKCRFVPVVSVSFSPAGEARKTHKDLAPFIPRAPFAQSFTAYPGYQRFFSRVQREFSVSAEGRSHEQKPETALEKSLAPRVYTVWLKANRDDCYKGYNESKYWKHKTCTVYHLAV